MKMRKNVRYHTGTLIRNKRWRATYCPDCLDRGHSPVDSRTCWVCGSAALKEDLAVRPRLSKKEFAEGKLKALISKYRRRLWKRVLLSHYA